MEQLILQLGDIIRIVSPKEPKFHEQTFYINYYDPKELLEIIHTTSLAIHQIKLENGILLNNHIEKIVILDRSVHKGFARQNGLIPGSWIELEFGADVRIIITALITHLEEDMIQLTTFPEENILYIDFAYKGIPKHIPLKQICLTKKPLSYKSAQESEPENDDPQQTGDQEVYSSYNNSGELELDFPKQMNLEKDYRDDLHEEYLAQLSQMPTPEPFQNEILLQPTQINYDVNTQMHELYDDLLFKIPDEKRTPKTMQSIYTHVQRFKELRENYSVFDDYHQVVGFIRRDAKNYKPLVQSLYHMNHKTPWIYPVASIRRYLYSHNENEQPDSVVSDLYDDLTNEADLIKELFYDNERPTSDYIKYQHMHNQVSHSFWTPFTRVENIMNPPLAKNIAVKNDMDMVVSHYDNLKATSVKAFMDGKDDSDKNIYTTGVLQRFNGPTHFPKYISRTKNIPEILLPEDQADIKSIVLLPEHIATESRIFSNTSSILEKANYKIPNKESILTNHKMKHKTIELKEDNAVFPLETTYCHIEMEPHENSLHDNDMEHPTFYAFLQAAIPNTFALIDKYYSENANSYNFTDYLKTLSHYHISHESLNFGLTQKIRKHIIDNINKYTGDFLEKRDSYGNYLTEKYHVVEPYNMLYRPFFFTYYLIKNDLRQDVITTYGLNEKYDYIERSEIINHIYAQDDQRLHCLYMLLYNIVLVTPQMVSEPYIEPKHFYDVSQKAISKKYNSVKEMQEDNNKRDLKYDKNYDANQYDAIVKYRKERSRMTPDEFIEFLTQKLAEDYGCSIHNTEMLAKELIQGYKLVQEGDYALLEIKPNLIPTINESELTDGEKEEIKIEENVRKVQKYYRRVNHNWIYDPDVDSSSFAKPSDLSCSMKDDEVIGKGGNVKFFANAYGTRMEDIETNVKNKIQTAKKQLLFTRELRQCRKHEVDQYHIRLGNQAYISEGLKSPYASLYQNINHWSTDFALKQSYLVDFKEFYCRDPLPNESPHWLYCLDTGIQMMPMSQFLLAHAFQENNYKTVLMQLVKKLGRVSDGYYVDKHCGNVLDHIDFSEQSGEIMMEVEEQNTWEPEEVENTYSIDEHSQKRLYKNSKMRQVYNVVSALAKNLFVPIESIENNCMSLVMDFMGHKDIFYSEEVHEQKQNDRKRTDENGEPIENKKVPYETYIQSSLLEVIVCVVIVSVQTIVPSFVPRRTFGDCVKTLDGYPLSEDSGAMGTVEYISCILRKMNEDKKTMPWKTISKKKGVMEKRIQRMFTKFVLKNERVNALYESKRAYLQTEVVSAIPKHLEVSNTWERFLPPLKETNVANNKVPLRNITSSVQDELKKCMNGGHPDQWKLLGMYFSKALAFSFGTFETINTIVKDKGNLLGKYASYTIVENACCNELKMSHNPILYFKNEDEHVLSYINSVYKIGIALDTITKSVKAPVANIKRYDKTSDIPIKAAFDSYSEYMIYQTFIKYTNLDNEIKPIPTHLETFLTEKPEDYNPDGSIEEKIQFLKDSGKSLNMNSFRSMMIQTYRENIIRLYRPISVSYHERVMQELDALKLAILGEGEHIETLENELKMLEKEKDKNKVKERPSDFRVFYSKFMKYLDRENIGSLEESEEKMDESTLKKNLLDDLENNLEKEIVKMKKEMVAFMDSLDVPSNDINNLMQRLETWDANLSYVSFGQFVKNYLYYICTLMPCFVLHGFSPKLNKSNWRLIKDDLDKLGNTVNAKYEYLEDFNKDPYLEPFMTMARDNLKSLYSFVSNFYGFFPEDRPSLYGRFFLFSLVFIFHYLISLTNKDDLQVRIFQNIQRNEEDSDEELFMDEDVETMNVADKTTVKMRVLKLIQRLLESRKTFHYDKTATLFTYKDIQEKVTKLEAAEKKRMMDSFKDIKDIKTRRSELLLKKYHLGKFYVDAKAIKKYGKKRDKMLNTEDTTETNILFGPDEITEEDVEDLMEEMMNPEEALEINPLFDMDSDDEDEDDNIDFLVPMEDEDAMDIAENAYDNL